MHVRDHTSTIRRLVLAGALVAVAIPGHGSEPAREIRTMPPIAPPLSRPEPLLTPTPTPTPTPPSTALEPAPPPPVGAPVAPDPVSEPISEPPASPPADDASPAAPAVVALVPPTGVAVYAHAGDARPASGVHGTTEFGTPRVLLTTLSTTTVTEPWVEVYLPTRPNGATGWVRASSVTLRTVPDRITVDLAARTVTWERGAEIVGVVRAAVGAAGTPTPTGTYFVTDVLPASEVGDAAVTGEYGAWVVALNGHSDAFTTFDGGDARIAIHGTNDSGSIGNAASSGCVRIGAGPLETLARNVPVGTPVVIR